MTRRDPIADLFSDAASLGPECDVVRALLARGPAGTELEIAELAAYLDGADGGAITARLAAEAGLADQVAAALRWSEVAPLAVPASLVAGALGPAAAPRPRGWLRRWRLPLAGLVAVGLAALLVTRGAEPPVPPSQPTAPAVPLAVAVPPPPPVEAVAPTPVAPTPVAPTPVALAAPAPPRLAAKPAPPSTVAGDWETVPAGRRLASTNQSAAGMDEVAPSSAPALALVRTTADLKRALADYAAAPTGDARASLVGALEQAGLRRSPDRPIGVIRLSPALAAKPAGPLPARLKARLHGDGTLEISE